MVGIFALLMVLMGAAAWAGDARPQVLAHSAYPDVSNNFAEASFVCAVPKQPPRAIFFLAGGTDSDARPWISDPRWQALAEREHLMLVAACMRGGGEAYEVASGGSGKALLEAIEVFAKGCPFRGIERLPLILYGHSAGSQFAYNFACWRPNRVLAIVGMKSGPLSAPPQGVELPFKALFIVGDKDEASRVRETARAFSGGRSKGAPWCLAIQPGAGHGSEGCRDLAEFFIKAVNGDAGGQSCYAELTVPGRMGSAASNAGSNPNWTWLPDASFAQTWRAFVKPISLQSLIDRREEPEQKQLLWRAVKALPESMEQPDATGKIEYAISLPDASSEVVQATVKATDSNLRATVERRSDHEWSVVGQYDFRQIPLGPVKSELQAEVTTSTGQHLKGSLRLFAHLTGSVAVSPPSLYYGVFARNSTESVEFVVKSKTASAIRSCEAVSSDPQFIEPTVTPSADRLEYRVKCVIHTGSRIGDRNGRLTLHVEADRPYVIVVPYYGFIKK